MLSQPALPFISSYKTYKKHTHNVEKYLFETVKAIRRGKRVPITSKFSPNADPPKGNSILRTSPFIEYATEIRCASLAIEAPREVICYMEEALHPRRCVAKFYASLTRCDEDNKSTEGHQRFIQILETVLKLSKPLVVTVGSLLVTESDKQTKEKSKANAPAAALENKFAALRTSKPNDPALNIEKKVETAIFADDTDKPTVLKPKYPRRKKYLKSRRMILLERIWNSG